MGWADFFKKDAAKIVLLELGADPDTSEKELHGEIADRAVVPKQNTPKSLGAQ
jgi:hypothetical protein